MSEPGNTRGWTFDTFEKWISDLDTARDKAIIEHNGLLQTMKEQTAAYVTRKELWLAVFAIIGAIGTLAGILFQVKGAG